MNSRAAHGPHSGRSNSPRPAPEAHLTGPERIQPKRARAGGLAQPSACIPATLGNLSELEDLNLTANELSGPLPAALGNLGKLKTLLIAVNAFSGSVPDELADLAELRQLNLAANNFSGAFPEHLTLLQKLEALDVADNQFDGELPAALANVQTLLWFDAADNALTGELPEVYGTIPDLTFFDVSGNHLTGGIPASFAGLESLNLFRVDGNDLSGLIPITFAEQSELFDCRIAPGNDGILLPDLQAYCDADTNGDGFICGLAIAAAEDIGEDAVDDLDELVPDVLNEGQANALTTKIENAIAKAATGQYGAAINQMLAFLNQLQTMVADGTLTPEEAAPFIEQAETLMGFFRRRCRISRGFGAGSLKQFPSTLAKRYDHDYVDPPLQAGRPAGAHSHRLRLGVVRSRHR